MINPDAKCVVNGPKVNEVIGVINDMLSVMVSEEFDVVESGNTPGKRSFVTGKLTGQKQQGANAARNTVSGNSSASSRNRNSLTSAGAGAAGAGAAGAGATAAGRAGPSAAGAGAGPGGSAAPKTESEYRSLVNRVRTGRASQEERDIFQSILDTQARNRQSAARQEAARRDPLEAQMHAKRQAAANRVAEENRMVWTYGQTGSKNTGANWLTKYTDNGGIYQR